MIVAGIDTDVRGAVAILDTTTNKVLLHPLPNRPVMINKKKRTRLDLDKIKSTFPTLLENVHYVFLEKQNARPGQGVTSSFTFGQTYGTIIGAVMLSTSHTCKVNFVTAAKWKGSMGGTSDKKQTVALATSLAPEISYAWKLSKNTSSAEAFLIALYGAISVGTLLPSIPITAA